MGQQVIVNHAKHGTRMKKNQNGRKYRSRRHNRCSLQLFLASKMIVVGAAVVVILISMIYTNLTSLQFFWLELMTRLWRLMCGLFTPRNLFIVLNLLILSIFALAHLHSTSTSTPSSPSAAVNHSHDQHTISDHDYSGVKLNDADRMDGSAVGNSQQGGTKFDIDEMKLIEDDDRADNADQFADDSEVRAIHALNCWKEDENQDDSEVTASHCWKEEDNEDDKAMAATASSAAAGLMIKAESTSHFQLSAGYKVELSCSSDAKGKAGKPAGLACRKAEKAKAEKPTRDRQSIAGVSDKLIDSLLSEEGSIFSGAEMSRPLASARFTTRKKATTTNDRPLSPNLRISKPILKRGETLEATWKAICESKRQLSPFNRHYTTNESNILHAHDAGKLPRSSFLSPIKMRSKATRHHDHDLTRAQLMRKREPSMPHEELNAKVESFISRFNAQIKIQREKSLLEYMEMVGRGAS